MPTLAQYRRAAAKDLGKYVAGTATSGSTAGLLECTAALFKSTLSQDDLYKDYFLMRPGAASAADAVRIVDTYTASAGTFLPDQPWAASPWNGATGETFELHGHPIEPYTDLADLINRALQRMMVTVEISFTPTAQTIRQTLAANAWLTDPRWVYQAGWLAAGQSREQVDPYVTAPLKGDVVNANGTIYFNWYAPSFQGTETVYLWCIKPAYNACRATGGTFGSQAGLSLETDECTVATEWLSAAVAVWAWDKYGHLLERSPNQEILRDASKAAAWFNEVTEYNFQEPQRTLQRVRQFGPARYQSGIGW